LMQFVAASSQKQQHAAGTQRQYEAPAAFPIGV
jgi:hypothetical protein